MLKRKPKNQFTEEELDAKYPAQGQYRIVENVDGTIHVDRRSRSYDLTAGEVRDRWYSVKKPDEEMYLNGEIQKFDSFIEAEDFIQKLKIYPKYTYR